MNGPMAQSACSHCQPWHSEAAFPQLGQEQRTKGALQGGVPPVQPCSSLLLAGCCVSPLLVTGHTLHENPSPGCTRQKRLLWAGLARIPPGSAAATRDGVESLALAPHSEASVPSQFLWLDASPPRNARHTRGSRHESWEAFYGVGGQSLEVAIRCGVTMPLW